MSEIRPYQVKRVDNQHISVEMDAVVVEAPLQISINDSAYTVVMRTPGSDKELIRGLLYAEDIYKGLMPLEFDVLPFRS